MRTSTGEDRIEEKYYTTGEVAKKLELSDQIIRRFCEKGIFKGARL